jgi:hypothetical protein
MLWKDALVMYDRQTETLWSHLSATAIHGPLKGMTLKPYPAVHTTWREWRRLYPEGQVLSKRSPPGGTKGRTNVYQDYMADPNRLGIFGTRNADATLPGKEYVLGLTLREDRVAYPFRHLSRFPLIHDTVGFEPVVVVFVAPEATAIAFSRRIGTRTMQFTRLHRAEGHWAMEDTLTGSTWLALKGEAIAGPLKGSQLTPLPGHQAFWFAWKGLYPQSRLWTGS